MKTEKGELSLYDECLTLIVGGLSGSEEHIEDRKYLFRRMNLNTQSHEYVKYLRRMQDILANELSRVQPHLCTWNGGYSNTYITSCGNAFTLTIERDDNKICPNCNKKIEYAC